MNLSYLYTPIQMVIDPPIDTMDQELPLEKLSWEDFEKLCLAIIQLEFNINVCEIYGIKGQAQEGIDIFARQANGRYSSYQCKRYQEFDFGDLQKAVDYFKDKKFYDQSDKLYLCTSCEWNKTQIQDKFEELKTELEKVNIELVKWDKIQLSRFLKTQPQIVYDYFGEAWVKKFNGDAALKHLSKSKKLDANQVVKYRNELYEFYSTIFNIQDPGIPIKELNNPYIIQDRFIVPDIISNLNEDNFEIGGEKISKLNDNDQERFYHEDYWYGQNEEEDRSKKINFKDTIETNSIDIRLKIDEALINSDRNIIIGDPGAGKSTLLRYIVLDILSPNPKLENISQKYGKLLPVWLPFAFITRHLSLNDSLSISEILNLWFKSFGKINLFDLASNALEDERLFLIIDGIDEWNNISSAQQAITRVETIRGLYDCQVLYSSRPYGFRILKDYFTNLKVLNLAGFSNSQQRDFVERWYSKWASLQKDIKDTEFSKRQSDHFIKELKKTGDLKKLAETPLLLSILIIQKLRDSVLPKNKLEALKDITQYLINKHPAKRVSDAGIVDDKTIDLDYKDIFCELAIHIQYASNDGVILKNEARKIIEKYLINYAAYDKVKAKVRSKELIDVGANSFGIIVEKSNDEISFSHKQFQEFLAAQYLFESDEEFADDFIKKFAGNPTCHQIIVSFFGLIPIKQVNKFKKFFKVLNNANHEVYQENYLKLLSYEIAINLDNAPIEIVNNSFDLIISDFELETEPLYKEALLRRILAALQSARLKEKVHEFLIRYVPNQAKYRDHRVNPLGFVNRLNTSQFEFLTKVFINGTTQIRYDASHVFKIHITDQRVKDFLNNIILSCSNPEILAFAINSIITNDLVRNDVETLLQSVKVKAPIVEFFLHKYKVFIKKQTAKDLDGLLSILNEMPYELKQEVVNLLIDGYGKSKKLKKILIKSTQQESRFSDDFTTDDKVAWKVLFHCYNKDSEVIELIKLEFDKEYPFSGERYDILRHLVHYFQGNQVLKPTVEKWLSSRLEDYHSIDNESAFACVFIKSENTKNILLNDLSESGIAHWPVMALLDGWSDDLEINHKLKNYFKTETSKKTAAAAGFIPKVFENDKVEGVKILEKILFDEKVYFRDRAISALIELDKLYFERNVLERLLDVLESFPKDGFNQYYSAIEDIAKNFSSNSKVESYILRGVESDRNMYGVFALYFPKKNNQEEKELKRSLPLSKKLRLLIIEKFNELNFLPSSVEEAFTYFDQEEEEEEVKGDIALCVFNHLRLRNPDKIIELCNPLVFGRGFDHEIKRNIAFAGF